MTGIEHDGRDDVELFKREALAPQPFAGCGQRHFGVSGARQHHGRTHLVVGQPRHGGRIEGVFPAGGRFGEAPAEQRVHAPSLDEPVAFAGQGVPVTLALPGVIGQAHVSGGPGEQRAQRWLIGQQVDAQGGLFEPRQAVIVAAQGGQHAACSTSRGQALADVALQHRVRADFDEHAAAQADEPRHRIGHAHRLAHVAPPVVRIEPGVIDRVAGDGGHERRTARGRRRQAGQAARQTAFDRIHLTAVECVVEIELPEEHAARLDVVAHAVEVAHAARDGHVGRAVDAGDFDVDGQLAQHASHVRMRQGHRRHAAGTTGEPLRGTARTDDAHGLIEIERTGRPGR